MRVQLQVEAAPGLQLSVDREQDSFFVVLGKWAIHVVEGEMAVGEYAQAGWRDSPVLKVPI